MAKPVWKRRLAPLSYVERTLLSAAPHRNQGIGCPVLLSRTLRKRAGTLGPNALVMRMTLKLVQEILDLRKKPNKTLSSVPKVRAVLRR